MFNNTTSNVVVELGQGNLSTPRANANITLHLQEEIRITRINVFSPSVSGNPGIRMILQETGVDTTILGGASNTNKMGSNSAFLTNRLTFNFRHIGSSGLGASGTFRQIEIEGYRRVFIDPDDGGDDDDIIAAPNEVYIDFRQQGVGSLGHFVLEQNSAVTNEMVNFPFTGFIPTHRRFSHWQTVDGLRITDGMLVPVNMAFYATMKSNFERGTDRIGEGQPNNTQTDSFFFNRGRYDYTNETIRQSFTQRGFQPDTQNLYMQARRDPVK